MTPVEAFFFAIEESPLSQWVRGESMFAFPLIISAHTLGMGFLAGVSSAMDLRLLGVAKGVPISALERFYPVLWLALAVNFVSGTFLFIGYPYKAITNPVFAVKLLAIAAAIYLVLRIRSDVLRAPESRSERLKARAKLLASLSLVSWAVAILAGRLLAYTFTWLRVGVPGGF